MAWDFWRWWDMWFWWALFIGVGLFVFGLTMSLGECPVGDRKEAE